MVNNAPTASSFQYDGRGTVRMLTNATGVVTDAYEYDAFGKPRIPRRPIREALPICRSVFGFDKFRPFGTSCRGNAQALFRCTRRLEVCSESRAKQRPYSHGAGRELMLMGTRAIILKELCCRASNPSKWW